MPITRAGTEAETETRQADAEARSDAVTEMRAGSSDLHPAPLSEGSHMTKKMKVRTTFAAGILIGAAVMFIGLAGQDAEAPPTTFVRLIEPRVYVDNDARPCPIDALSVAGCRAGRGG